MSTPQVGAGAVAIMPTFRGFRSAVTKETTGAAQAAAKGFRGLWSREGSESGQTVGKGFRAAFQGEAKGFATASTRELEQNVAKATRTLSAARLKQLDQAGKVRVAEAQLAEAQQKHASNSSQVLRATERLASETRKLETANETATAATSDLRGAQEKLARAADQAGEQLQESGQRGARRFASGFSEIFKGSFLGSFVGTLSSNLVSGIGNAVRSTVRSGMDLIGGSIDIASDLSESVNAVAVSYGDVADEILKMGDTSAETFGLSKRDLNQYAVQFSAFSKSIAGESGDVAGTFESILGRATDFASVMNLEVAEALQLVQSGLAGETEPLRRFGIDLSAAAVEAYALSSGLVESTVDSRKLELAQNKLSRATESYSQKVKQYGEESTQASAARDAISQAEIGLEKAMEGSTGQLTEAQKQQARYQYLLEQTSQVQGDFANTSDELANKNRINAAEWDNLQAKLGESFLPIASQVADVLNQDILPAVSEMIDEFGPQLQTALEEAGPAIEETIGLLVDELPDLLAVGMEALPGIIQAGKDMIPVLTGIADTIGGIAEGVNTFTENNRAFFDDVRDNLGISNWNLGRPNNAVLRAESDRTNGVTPSGDGRLGGYGSSVTQVNNFEGMDPAVAIELTAKALNKSVRR